MAMSERIPRRVVTGHDEAGRSVFLSDGPAPQVRDQSRPGVLFYEVWSTSAEPAPITAAEAAEPNDRAPTIGPGGPGSLIRVIDFLPGGTPRMHRTETVDYGIVLEGEIWAVLEDSETVLRTGDICVQRGTNHAWHNRSDAVARVAFILLNGQFQGGLRKLLGDVELLP
jgi:quercetin dioxygenase-like cupin family protein